MTRTFLTVVVLSAAAALLGPSPAWGGKSDKKDDRRREGQRSERSDGRGRAVDPYASLPPTTSPSDEPTTAPSEEELPADPPTDRARDARRGDGRNAEGRNADGRRTTGEKMQDVLKQQEQAKNALRRRVEEQARETESRRDDRDVAEDAPPPPTPAEQLAEAQTRLDGEIARHDSRLAELRREEQDARNANDRKRVRKSIDQENASHQRVAAELRKQVRQLQARVDDAAAR